MASKRKKQKVLSKYTIYTDGACRQDQKNGGWAAVLIGKEGRIAVSGYCKTHDSYRMELQAAIEALLILSKPSEVRLYSDSSGLIEAFAQGKIGRWHKNGWRKDCGGVVAHSDLWEKLYCLSRKHRITWFKVKAHSGNRWNTLCDKLAAEAIKTKPDAKCVKQLHSNDAKHAIADLALLLEAGNYGSDILFDIDYLMEVMKKVQKRERHKQGKADKSKNRNENSKIA